MKKALTFVVTFLLIFPSSSILAKSDLGITAQDVLAIYEGVTLEELQQQIADAAEALGTSEEEITKQIYAELRQQQLLTQLEEAQFGTQSDGKGNGKYTLGSSSKGNLFYETASTIGISHGHIGMYYSTATLIESVPSAGVRSLSRTNKKVDNGARIQSVKSSYATSTQKTNAANWAYGRRGESYSYNFATNRQTSCVGAKNCSKLVWCAFKDKAGIDLDHNKGLGVYPKDIRDSSMVQTLKTY
ncbi:hypothetical protein [Bacillus horti]|uniref:Uncharacterized protein YycO n=1 Tax=Caldalkalibacillus horti TaxID=77523 RepID=A0ABT9W2C8_9BACI|nr:hypothetical protein [Bacillus horti]MDQ0167410.1 uncharacterized protein YycO [Bacillus horti]